MVSPQWGQWLMGEVLPGGTTYAKKKIGTTAAAR
jgi:hypothetical protein